MIEKEKGAFLRCDISAETVDQTEPAGEKAFPGQGNSRHRGPEAGFVQGARCRHDVSKGELGGDEWEEQGSQPDSVHSEQGRGGDGGDGVLFQGH